MTVWFRSSPLFMVTEASGPCVSPPSIPCCGCCFGDLPSCTEGFTSGDPASPQDAEARAAFSLLSLLPSRAPSLFSLLASACCLPLVLFVRWPPLLFSLPSCLLVCCLVPVASPRVVGVGVVFGFWWVCSCLPCLLSFCWWFGALIGCLLTEVTKDF